MRFALPTVAVLTAAIAVPAGAATTLPTDLALVTCRDIMASDDRGRELSMAFMHGYLHGRAGTTTLELDRNAAITDKVRDHCLDNPSAKFLETFEAMSK